MGRHSDRELISVLKVTRLWDILCGLSLSQAKGAAERSSPVAARRAPSSAAATPPHSVSRTPPGAFGAACSSNICATVYEFIIENLEVLSNW